MRPSDGEADSPIWNLITDLNHLPPRSGTFSAPSTPYAAHAADGAVPVDGVNNLSLRVSNNAPPPPSNPWSSNRRDRAPRTDSAVRNPVGWDVGGPTEAFGQQRRDRDVEAPSRPRRLGESTRS